MTRWPTWFESSVWITARTPETTAITIIPPALNEIAPVSCRAIATRTRRRRNAGSTPRLALATISPGRTESRRQYGLNNGRIRRMLARRTAGSAGRSGGGSPRSWKNIPIGPVLPSGTLTQMRVTVRLFAGLRERAGRARLELEDVSRVEDVWPALGLSGLEMGDEPPGLLYAVNREYAEPGRQLVDGDEVALIPPVSGGSLQLALGPLDVAAVVREVESPEAGAIASFVGTVRRRSRGRDVLHLEYEAFEEMAEEMLERLAAELTERHGLCGVAVHHRLGRVEIGEASVAIAVSAPHRSAALDACREAIETLKTSIPLWKKEVYAGGEEWIGRGS